MADTLKHGLEQQIEQFLTEHPATKLVVIDTLQRVRSALAVTAICMRTIIRMSDFSNSLRTDTTSQFS